MSTSFFRTTVTVEVFTKGAPLQVSDRFREALLAAASRDHDAPATGDLPILVASGDAVLPSGERVLVTVSEPLCVPASPDDLRAQCPFPLSDLRDDL
jgi:hypothetical protein